MSTARVGTIYGRSTHHRRRAACLGLVAEAASKEASGGMERQQQREWERVARQRREEDLSKGSGGPRASHESILCLYSLLGNWGRARAGASSQTEGAVSRGVLGVRWPRRQQWTARMPPAGDHSLATGKEPRERRSQAPRPSQCNDELETEQGACARSRRSTQAGRAFLEPRYMNHRVCPATGHMLTLESMALRR